MTKSWKIAYYVSTGLISIGLVAGAFNELMQTEAAVALLVAMGYPMWLNYILGVAKTLAVIGIWQSAWPRLREWAYAGLVFNMVGAFASHLLAGQGFVVALPPLFFLVFVLISYFGLHKKMRAA